VVTGEDRELHLEDPRAFLAIIHTKYCSATVMSGEVRLTMVPAGLPVVAVRDLIKVAIPEADSQV
jgi:hypothetical protein